MPLADLGGSRGSGGAPSVWDPHPAWNEIGPTERPASLTPATSARQRKSSPKRASSETLAKGACLPAVAKPHLLGLSYSIRRQCRSDGVFFWHWEIRDERNWPVAFGNVFVAVRDALSAVRDHQAAHMRSPPQRR